MKRVFEHRKLLVWISLFGLVVLTACSHDDDDKPLELVKTQFNFSLPLKGLKLLHTRMDGEVVQVQGAPFRGMDDVRLLCFNTVPSESTTKIGNIIEINTSGSEVTSSDDYSQCQEEIHIPVSTSYFGFYARSGEVIPTTHAAKMRYGIIETVGLGKNTYQNNRSIRFRPVPICSSEDLLGGSLKGEALLELLNDLMSTTAEVAPPNDKWSTVNNIYLRDAYERMTTLKTLSSEHVQTMLAAINRIVCYEPTFTPDDQGLKLAEAIKVKIAGCCAIPPAYDDETIELKPKYQGFPADLGLPVGAARIEWDADLQKFVEPVSHTYGQNLVVKSINDYVYPMNLQYQVFSDIVASDDIIIQPQNSSSYSTWEDVLDDYGSNPDTQVQTTTQSVAMKQQVNYAVGRMALSARICPGVSMKDAKGYSVNVSEGFTLTGYIIGGQREVDYNFQPVSGTDIREYAIYDSYLNGESQVVVRQGVDFTAPDYILGLGTISGKTINIAMELVNNGDAFQGADGVIAHGNTFYLVAELDPANDIYDSGLTHIFDRDYATKVELEISSTGLATATYGLPRLDIPHPTVGLNVNLRWEDGLYYDAVELSRYVE